VTIPKFNIRCTQARNRGNITTARIGLFFSQFTGLGSRLLFLFSQLATIVFSGFVVIYCQRTMFKSVALVVMVALSIDIKL
jgi:hypothetical protein